MSSSDIETRHIFYAQPDRPEKGQKGDDRAGTYKEDRPVRINEDHKPRDPRDNGRTSDRRG